MKFPRTVFALAVSVLAFAVCSTAASAQDDVTGESDHSTPVGSSLDTGWLEPWQHSDFSRRGTPFIHLFNLEPAFLDRDLFVDFAFTAAEDADESELAAELEYALTRRLGIVLELPVLSLNPDKGDTERGLGDLAVAPRALLIETDRFLLSANLEVTFPTGSEKKGRGDGEAALAPSLSTWVDLGNWFTLSAQVGSEHGLETGDSEFFYACALTYSFRGPKLFPDHSHHHAADESAHGHRDRGMTSLIAEFSGRSVLSGEEQNRTTSEVLFGISHVLTETLEVRGAIELPLGGPQELDYGYVLSVIYHF
jgi:hypothetical protein